MEGVHSHSSPTDEERCDLTELVDDLLDAESGVFRLTHWGQRSYIYSRGSPQHVRELQENGHGLYVLRHGKCIEEIHDYFRKYESRKCCLGLVGGQNIRTRLRLVNSDSFTHSAVEIGIDVASPTSAYASQVDLRLSDEEYRVYKCALWCAVCPLLTAQKPPDDSSPPIELSEQPSMAHDSVQRLEKLRYLWSDVHSTVTPGFGTCDGQLISSDIMRDALCRAFGLNKHLELYYLKLGYKFHKMKNDAQILAEDLCYQLSLLEKNTHPYYNLNSFLSRRAYESWRHSTRRHLMEMMNKFWSSAMPPVGDMAKFDASSIHSDYRMLLHKLLRLQRLQYSKDPSTVTFAVVPSGATRKILAEFSLRYGIDELYHQATYLEYLTLNFGIEKEFIDLVTQTLQNIQSFLPPDESKALLVRQQVDQLKSCIDQLLRRCEHLFSHIQTVFLSTNCNDSIGSLIQLLEEIVRLRDYLLGSTESEAASADQMLKGYLEVNFQLVYIDHKMSALSDVTGQGQEGSQLSPRVINRIMSCLRDDLADYRSNYQKLFERYLNITELASVALYELLMKDVLELCQRLQAQNETEKVNFGMIGLAYRLNMLDHDLKEFIPLSKQTWREAYVEHVTRWFSALYHQAEYFLLRAVAQDEFFPLHIPRRHSADEEAGEVILDTTAILPSRPSAFSIVTSSPQHPPQAQESRNREEAEAPMSNLAPDEDSPASCFSKAPHFSAGASGSSDRSDTMEQNHSPELEDAILTGIAPPLDSTFVPAPVTNNAVPDTGESITVSNDVLPSPDKIPVSGFQTPASLEFVTKTAEVGPALGNVTDDRQSSSCASQSDDAFPAVINVVPGSGDDVPVVTTPCMPLRDDVPYSRDVVSTAKNLTDDKPGLDTVISHPSGKDPAMPSLCETSYTSASASSIPVSADVMPLMNSPVTVLSEISAVPPLHDVPSVPSPASPSDGSDTVAPSVAAIPTTNEDLLPDVATQVLPITNDLLAKPSSDYVNSVPVEPFAVTAERNETEVLKETETLTGKMEIVQKIDSSRHVTEKISLSPDDDNILQAQEKEMQNNRIFIQNQEDVEAIETRCPVVQVNSAENQMSRTDDERQEARSCEDLKEERISSETGSIQNDPETDSSPLDRMELHLNDKETSGIAKAIQDSRCIEVRPKVLDKLNLSEQEPMVDVQGELVTEGLLCSELVVDRGVQISSEGLHKEHENTFDKKKESNFEHAGDSAANVSVDFHIWPQSFADSRAKVETNGVSRRSNDASVKLSDQSNQTDLLSGNVRLLKSSKLSDGGSLESDDSSKQLFCSSRQLNGLNDQSDNAREGSEVVGMHSNGVQQLSGDGSSSNDEEDDSESSRSNCNLPELKLVGCLRDVGNSDAVNSVTNRAALPRPVHLPKPPLTSSQDMALQQPSKEVSAPVTRARFDQLHFDSFRHDRRMGNQQSMTVLVTSSVIDVLCLLQRLTYVVETVGGALYYPEVNHQQNGDSEVIKKMAEFRTCLKDRLTEMLQKLVYLYAKNLLAMDLCAISQRMAASLTGNQLIEDLKQARASIWGCRHKTSGADCLQFVNRHEEFRDNRHEPLTKEMCQRINDLLQLRKTLKIFFEKSASLWSSAPGSETGSLLVNTEAYMNESVAGLINVLVYRMQLFLVDFLDRLVISQLPSNTVLETTLQPMKSFLTDHLTSLRRWLCPETYFAFLNRLWLSLSWCFEKCALDIQHNPTTLSGEYAGRLLQTIIIIIRLITSLHSTSERDGMMVRHLDAVLNWLQLYFQSTSRLITTYRLLCLKRHLGNGDTLFPEGCNLETFERMRHDLHSSRKCFQGQQLVDWIDSHPQAFHATSNHLDENRDEINRENVELDLPRYQGTGHSSPFDVAQVFLDAGLVLPVESCSPPSRCSSTSMTSDPYPRLVLCGTIKQVNNDVTNSVGPSPPPRDDSHLIADAGSTSSNVQANWYGDGAGTMNGAQSEPDNVADGAVSSSNGPSLVPPTECLLNSTSPSIETGSVVFHPEHWYQIPSPEELLTTLDPEQALSAGRVQELRQCLQFFTTKRLKKGMILSVLESRKRLDPVARQFIISLPREIISKYPWMYVREQSVLACLGLRL